MKKHIYIYEKSVSFCIGFCNDCRILEWNNTGCKGCIEVYSVERLCGWEKF